MLQFPGQLAGDVLEHHRKATGLLEGQGLAFEGFLAGGGVALAAVAQLVDGLGGQADVPHHRDAAAHQAIDHGKGFGLGPLELHRCRGGFLEHPAGRGHGLIRAALVGEEREIADQQGLLGLGCSGHAPGGGPAVVQHLVEGDRQGGAVAQHHHGQGVAHQDGVGAGFGHDGG